jgi:hypothetical protein
MLIENSLIHALGGAMYEPTFSISLYHVQNLVVFEDLRNSIHI